MNIHHQEKEVSLRRQPTAERCGLTKGYRKKTEEDRQHKGVQDVHETGRHDASRVTLYASRVFVQTQRSDTPKNDPGINWGLRTIGEEG